jgi:hypothetical protein
VTPPDQIDIILDPGALRGLWIALGAALVWFAGEMIDLHLIPLLCRKK